MRNTKVRELMTVHPSMIDPEQTVKDAARKMKEIDCGVLPVGDVFDPIGMITDRDITIRAVSQGQDPETTKVKDVMSSQVYSCNEEDSLSRAADVMYKHKISRLIVKDYAGKVSGILSFGGILRKDADANELAEVIEHAVGHRVA